MTASGNYILSPNKAFRNYILSPNKALGHEIRPLPNPNLSFFAAGDCDDLLCRRSERVALEAEERRRYVDGWGDYAPDAGTGNPWNIPPP